jgi:hypothetical protein
MNNNVSVFELNFDSNIIIISTVQTNLISDIIFDLSIYTTNNTLLIDSTFGISNNSIVEMKGCC